MLRHMITLFETLLLPSVTRQNVAGWPGPPGVLLIGRALCQAISEVRPGPSLSNGV